MTTLEDTLRHSHDWAVDRIHFLCNLNEEEEYQNAYSVHKEFDEWLNPNIDEHNVFSLQFLGDEEYDRT
jgi:hypothetical protein